MAVLFDTHAVLTKLPPADFAAEQVEALLDALKRVHESGVEALATKHDLQALELRLANKLEGLRGSVDARFVELQGKISLLNWILGAKGPGEPPRHGARGPGCPPQTAGRPRGCLERSKAFMWIRAVKDGKRRPKVV
jgi:hypothetical protein